MSARPIDDAAARELVRGPETVTGPITEGSAFAPDTCLVVRAGAGSGKTRALVERMVALVRSGVPLRNMAAITFTVRAAGEMRHRFYTTLRETAGAIDGLLAVTPDPLLAEERDRLVRASDRTDDLFVDTIHSFCRTLLSERPFEAGVPPDFRQVDDREEAEMRRAFWHGHLDRELRTGPRPMSWWSERGVDPSSLSAFFGARCTHEDLPLAEGRPDAPDLAPVVERAVAWLDRVLPAAPPAGPNRDGLTDTLHRMNRYRRLMDMESPGGRASFLGMLDGLVGADGGLKKDVLRVRMWQAFGGATASTMESIRDKADDPVVEPLGAFVLSTVRPPMDAWKEYLYGEISSFVDGAVEAYRKHRCDEGLLTFQDLLLRSADLLRTSPEARRHFRRRYTHLLVDEFQDTDPVQAEVVFLLTASDQEIQDWNRVRPEPGSLFLVGDDKQSIYRFRRADVQVFRQAVDLVESGGGRTVRFVTNFRSEARICDWVNRAVAPSFTDTEPYQAPWEDLHPYEGTGSTRAPVVALDLDKQPGNKGRLVAREEAGRITGMIRRLIAGEGVPTTSGAAVRLEPGRVVPGDILVLVRVSTHAAEYTRALDAAGIPYVTSGGKSLGKEFVTRALLALLEAALDPDDPVAVVAALRGPFVGASDEELRQFRAAGGTFRPDADDQPPSSHEGIAPVRDGFRLVVLARRLFETRPVGEAMATLLYDEGLLAAMAVRQGGSASAGALVRLLGVARDIQGKGGGWMEWMDELRRLVAGELQAEAQTLEAGDSAVRVMTVHQAKGLQARVVFLAYPVPTREQPVDFHVDRSSGRPMLYLPCRDGRSDIALPVGWKAAETEARRFETAEERRLVYVAATRAKELLVVSRYPAKLAGPWEPLYTELERVPTVDAGGLSDDSTPVILSSLSHEEGMGRLERTMGALVEAARPTWVQESVTGGVGDVDSGADPFAVETEGLGRGYGRAVHRMFQTLIEGRPGRSPQGALARLARRLILEETGAPDADMVDRAVAAVTSFLDGPLWAEIVSSDQVLSETPFIRVLDGEEGQRLVSGVIDLAFRSGSGWAVVDFKTESGDGDLLRKRHGSQLEAYRTHWEELTGENVVKCLIWPAVPGARSPVDCMG